MSLDDPHSGQHPDRRRAELEGFLAACRLGPAVHRLRPDYRAMLVAVDGLAPAAQSDGAAVEALVRRAEQHAREVVAAGPVAERPHVAAWREAFRAFGAKPQRTRSSLEALLRRAEAGLPRVTALTDLYNAISVLHEVPLGGEDLARYAGPARLVAATGDEVFDTLASGEAGEENPRAGEIVWRDDRGVTCRRWNWRQGRRTALTEETDAALFILDALEPMTDAQLDAAVAELLEALRAAAPGMVSATRRLVAEDTAADAADDAADAGARSDEEAER